MLLAATGMVFFHIRSAVTLFGTAWFLLLGAAGFGSASFWWSRTDFCFSTDVQVRAARLISHAEEKDNSLLFHALITHDTCDSLLKPLSEGEPLFLLYFPKDSAAAALRQGDELLIETRLKPPANAGNPDEWDYARYLRRKGVSGTAYVAAGQWRVTGHSDTRTLDQTAADYRKKLAAFYRTLGLQGDELAVLTALTTGDKEELDEEIRATYATAGASHILALSGLHIGLLYMLCWYLFSPLWQRWRWSKTLLLSLIVLALWAFACFTGFSSSVVRSVLLFSFLALSSMQSEKPIALNSLAAAAFFMLLFRPFWLFDIGFQLSFTAVTALLLFYPYLSGMLNVHNKFLRYFWNIATASLAAQIGTAPLVMFYFSQLPVHFLLTSLCVIPLLSVIMYAVLLLFLSAPFPALQQFLADGIGQLLSAQHALLRGIEQLPFASLSHLWSDAVITGLLYLCMIAFYRTMLRHTASRLCLFLTCVLLTICYLFCQTVSSAPHPGIAFYNVRGCSAVHCLSGGRTSWMVYADSTASKERLFRALSSHWDRLRLDTPQTLSEGDTYPEISLYNQILSYRGTTVCLLHDQRWRECTQDTPLPIDYLYVSRGYSGGVKELTLLFRISHVILDSSLTPVRQRQLQTDCLRLKIPCHSISDKGSFSVQL